MTESVAIARASNLDVYSVEGIDGSGKTSFIDYFCTRLETLHKEPLLGMRLPIKTVKLVMIEGIDKILASKQNVDMRILQAANSTVVKLWQHRKTRICSTDTETPEQPTPIGQPEPVGAVYDYSVRNSRARLSYAAGERDDYEKDSIGDDTTECYSASIDSYFPVYILDRGRASYYAYQIYAKANTAMLPYLLESMRSDIGYRASPEYLWLDISPSLAQEAIDSRGNPTGFDQASLDFKEKLRAGYNKFFTKYDTHCLKIPVDQIRKDYASINECNEAIFQLWCEKYLSKLIDKINRRFRRF